MIIEATVILDIDTKDVSVSNSNAEFWAYNIINNAGIVKLHSRLDDCDIGELVRIKEVNLLKP